MILLYHIQYDTNSTYYYDYVTYIIKEKMPARYRCKLHDECGGTTHTGAHRRSAAARQGEREGEEGTTHPEVRLSLRM